MIKKISMMLLLFSIILSSTVGAYSKSECRLDNIKFLKLKKYQKHLNAKGGNMVVVNANIITMDPDQPRAQSMVIRNGKIKYIGPEENIPEKKLKGKIIDAKGDTIIPGLYDNHVHPHVLFTLSSPGAPELQDAKSIDEVLNILKEYVDENPHDPYPRMFGWRDEITQGKPIHKSLTRDLIDKVVPNKPVYLIDYSGHRFWANTKALKLAEVYKKQDPTIPNTVVIIRDPATGIATGLLEESEAAATDGILIRSVKKIGAISFKRQVAELLKVLHQFSSEGITSIRTKDGNSDITDIYQELLCQDILPVRASLDSLYTPFSKEKDIKTFAKRAKRLKNAGLPKNFLRADGIKLILDLVPETHQAWFFDDYADGHPANSVPAVKNLPSFRKQFFEADKHNLIIDILAIGDRAVYESLNTIEEAIEKNPDAVNRRYSIEHAEFIQDRDIPRIKDMNVIASFNPMAAYPNMELQKRLIKIIGIKRLSTIYHRWKDLMDIDAKVVNGSDYPLAPALPFLQFHLMMNGTNVQGEQSLFPIQILTFEETLKTYTANAAYAAFAENRSGVLKEGYDADFVVLSGDPSPEGNIPPDEISTVTVKATIINGHIVYKGTPLFSDTPKSIVKVATTPPKLVAQGVITVATVTPQVIKESVITTAKVTSTVVSTPPKLLVKGSKKSIKGIKKFSRRIVH